MKEIKIVGRGGQGGKTAAEIIAKIMMNKGKQIQSFPEYGAERQGAPVFAYTRIDDKKIIIHSEVKNPDIIAIIDPTLIIPRVVEGIKEDGILIVNTQMSSDEVRKHTKLKLKNVYCVDATTISVKHLGKNIPNTPILGAISKATGLFSLKDVESEIKHKFDKKIGPELTKKNIDSIREAATEVRK